nr:SDR family oxidoreductase [Saccharopolyspora sp. HNM0983]
MTVLGAGGMGLATARRIGSGHRVLLADFDEDVLAAATERLRDEGFEVTAQRVDVSVRAEVRALADRAAELGPVAAVVHTAGLSPEQASADAVLAVDLVGVALVLDEFARVVAAGGAGVIIASMAGHLPSGTPDPERDAALMRAPAEDLPDLPAADSAVRTEAGAAYAFAKRANLLRVQAAAAAWGERGARVNSISPGIISTAMGRQELAGDSGGHMRAMIDASPTGRAGTPHDIAGAAEFLLSPAAGFITGNDLLVDGGVVAAVRAQYAGDG